MMNYVVTLEVDGWKAQKYVFKSQLQANLFAEMARKSYEPETDSKGEVSKLKVTIEFVEIEQAEEADKVEDKKEVE